MDKVTITIYVAQNHFHYFKQLLEVMDKQNPYNYNAKIDKTLLNWGYYWTDFSVQVNLPVDLFNKFYYTYSKF